MAKKQYRILQASACITMIIMSSMLFMGGANDGLVGTAEAATTDKFGVTKLYPTYDNREWYVNMNDPESDSRFRNVEGLSKAYDGSWQVKDSDGQVRLEAWSPAYKKWKNVEITAYFKITSGNALFQMYSRGGHHTSTNECLGSAYKARIYDDGETTWVKEVTHPAYAGNRGHNDVSPSIKGKWIGFKAVMYNYQENGKTYVMLKNYVDTTATDSNGNLKISNNWKLSSVVRDTGGWKTSDSDFDSSCGRARDSILTGPGGTSSQNIAGWRTDDATWRFKYLSVREIIPPS